MITNWSASRKSTLSLCLRVAVMTVFVITTWFAYTTFFPDAVTMYPAVGFCIPLHKLHCCYALLNLTIPEWKQLSLTDAQFSSRQVHERQTARMRTRSEWFLTPVGERLAATDSDPTAMHVLRGSNRSSSGNIGESLQSFYSNPYIVSKFACTICPN